ncbi:MAG: EAL domain-containing protein [Acholeplasmatales bacterium]|nr:EAL domain-containing protein [Acholeplasmatales bacterium]
MNILLQLAGVAVMIVIFIFYFVERKSAVRSNQMFLYQAISIFASLILDILSIVMINEPEVFNIYLTKFVCKLYLVTVVLVVCLGLVYCLGDIERINFKFFSRMCMTTFIMLMIGIALILFTPITVVHDPNGLNDYTEGIPIIVTYTESFIVMAITVAIVVRYRKHIYRKRVIGVFTFITLWVVGSGLQGIFNYMFSDLGITVLSVSLSEALGSLVIYIMLENPSLNEDKITGALNQRAFNEYATLCMKKHLEKEFILINYDTDMSNTILSYDEFSKSITKTLMSYNIEKIFKNDRNDFIVVRKKNGARDLKSVAAEFKDDFYKNNDILVSVGYKILHFNDLTLFKDANDFLEVMRYLNINLAEKDRGIYEITEEIVSEVHNSFELKKKCDMALAKGNVEVFYQPIYSNDADSFTAAEALVRLRDDDGNLIYPKDFIVDMEHDGKILDLGKKVFESVCLFICEHNMEELGLHYIEVNLSTIQCMQEGFADSFIRIVKRYGVNPKYINFEITETGEEAKQSLLRNMRILKEYGFSFSLDDFGTGNANLNYIVEMPVDIVKFDKGMVDSYFKNGIAKYVMDSAISMIKGLKYKVVFEGIEEDEQINVARAIKVDYIQGYYYSKPISRDSFIEFLTANN